MKKRIYLKLISILCVATILSVTTPAFAVAAEEFTSPETTQQTGQIMPLTEETVWITRDYNGRAQRRLWSITRRCWLTDWIDI